MGPDLWLALAACTGQDAPGFDVSFGTGQDAGVPVSSVATPPLPPEPLEVPGLGAWRAQWTEPTRIALAPDGTARVTEPRHGRVYVLSADGAVLRAVKVGGEPLAVGVDLLGRTWVGDANNGEIRVYDPDWRWAFSAGDGPGEAARPSDLAMDPSSGWVYVTDSLADEVRVYASDGAAVGTFDGGADGYTSLLFPTGITVHDSDVWVVSHLLRRVVRFTLGGEPVAWFGVLGENPGELYTPQGLAVDDDGRLWVADARLGRVTAFDPTGVYLGHGGAVGAAPGQLGVPMDLVVDGRGRLLVTSPNNARVELYAVPGSAR